MRLFKKALLLFVILFLFLGLAGVFLSDVLFRSQLRGQLADLQRTHGLQVSFEDASLKLRGGVRIQDLIALDLDTNVEVARFESLDVEFGWFGLLSSPITIDRVALHHPELTLSAALIERLSSGAGEGQEALEGPDAGEETIAEEPSGGLDFLVRQVEVTQGSFRFEVEESTREAVVAAFEASAQNLSSSEPFEVDFSIEGQQQATGKISFHVSLNPTSYDGRVELNIENLSLPPSLRALPVTNGKVSAVVENNLSHILTTGELNMEKAPPAIPEEIKSGEPFALHWNIESEAAEGVSGRLALKTFQVAVEGLKGGTQELTGDGFYDPDTSEGRLAIRGDGLSVSLLNPFVEPGAGMRIQRGTAGVVLEASRSGEDSPFGIKGNIDLADLLLHGIADGGTDLEFKKTNLNVAAEYSPNTDRIDLRDLSIRIDDIPLSASGRVDGVMEEARRELDLVVRGRDLELGRIVALVYPAFLETGSLAGKAGIDLQISGQMASENFPILVGSLSAQDLTVIPKDSPEMKVSVSGEIEFDSSNVQAESLDLKLAGIPGKLSFQVQGYNSPKKQVNATVKGVAIDPVVNLFQPDVAGYLTGNLDGTVSAVMGAEPLPEALEVTVNVGNGRLFVKNPVPKAVADSLGWKWLAGKYPLTTARGKIVQADGTFRLEDFLVAGKEGGLSFSGQFDPKGNLSASARLTDSKSAKGEFTLNANLDPETFDGDLKVDFKGLTYPTKEGTLPTTNGSISALLGGNLSRVVTSGKISMAEAPAAIPAGMRAGTPFGLEWKIDSRLPGKGGGEVNLQECKLTVTGLKGGSQSLAGEGAYDPATAKGKITVRGSQVSVPLMNPFIETGTGMRILSGRANLFLGAARAGSESPFDLDGEVEVFDLGMRDLEQKKPPIEVKTLALKLSSQYAPTTDRLTLRNVSLKVDEIPLNVSGRIDALGDSAKREIDLNVKGENLDLGKLVPMFAPSFKETGTLYGKAAVALNISGKTASKKFPILVGNVDTKGVTLVPAKSPEMKAAVRGNVLFDSSNITADSLDIKLGDVPGKLALKVKGYNEPKKNVTATVRGIAIEPVMKIYKPSAAGILIGNLNANITAVIGAQSRPDALDLDFTIDDGVLLTKHPIPSAIVNIVQWEWMKNGIRLTNAKGKIVQERNGYAIKSLFLMGDKGGITARGLVGFDDRLDVETRLNVAKVVAGELNPMIQKALRAKEGSDWAYLGIDLKGTVSKPVPVPQFDALLDAGIDQLRERVGEEVMDRYGDQIRERTGVDTDSVIEGAGGLIRGIFKKEK